MKFFDTMIPRYISLSGSESSYSPISFLCYVLSDLKIKLRHLDIFKLMLLSQQHLLRRSISVCRSLEFIETACGRSHSQNNRTSLHSVDQL